MTHPHVHPGFTANPGGPGATGSMARVSTGALDLLMIVSFGQQPTTDWIGNTPRLMLTDDRFAVTLIGGRRSVSQALTEVRREDTPQQIFAGRYATRPTMLAGQHILAGDLLLLGLAAANNDPSSISSRRTLEAGRCRLRRSFRS